MYAIIFLLHYFSTLQVPLGSTLAQQIAGEYRDLTDINRSLALLDVAIGYLVSVDREPETLLKHFMRDQLTLKAALHSEQVQCAGGVVIGSTAILQSCTIK